MKNLVLLCIVALCSQGAYAQLWRLSAHVYYQSDSSGDLRKIDSAQYYYDYSSSRGSNADNSIIKYNKKKKYDVTTGKLVLNEDFTQTFYPNDDIFTNTRMGYDSFTKKWGVLGIDSFYYTPSGKVAWQTIAHWIHKGGPNYALYNDERFVYTYDANDNMVSSAYYFSYVFTNVWTNKKLHKYEYRNGVMVADTLFGPGLNNNWREDTLWTFHYDTAQRLTSTYRINKYLFTGYDTIHRTDYHYNALGQMDTSVMNFYTGNGNWIKGGPVTHRYYPGGQIESDTAWSRDTSGQLKFAATTHYGYNTAGQITRSRYWSAGGKAWMNEYIYEIYWPNNIPGTTSTDNALRIYPNPASGFVHIQLEGQYATGAVATIYDAAGRLVHHMKLPAGARQVQVPVAGLQAGNYFIRLTAGGKAATGQFVVQ